ncbi:MAG: hypothetical protein CL460_05145 [Acidimicrobiaceae bacterium]|nr:hypothetical protein [Acidimicrobiaceae bacterium]|tara:strand:- start:677 stop:1747 length:1071 start_codon:yes stop_codon:yes gene_type:complete
MRVAIDATPLIGIRTGIGVFVEGLLHSIREMEDRENRVEMAEYTLSLRARMRGQTRGTWVPIPAAQAPVLWRLLNAPKIERFLGKVDVVHGTNFVVPPSTCPRVLTIHDLSFLGDYPGAGRFNRRLHLSVRKAVESGATIHTISNFVGEEIRDKYGATDVRVVYPGISQSSTRSTSTIPMIVAVGTTQQRKGITELVKAFEILANHHKEAELQIVGPPGDSESQVVDCINRLPLEIQSRVHRVGYVDRQERDRLIADAMILAHPSYYEGFGLPVIEAMSMGTPVVTTTGGAIPEVVGDAALTVAPGQVEALAAALLELLNDERSRNTLISAGLNRSRKFNWSNSAQGMIDLYTSLA